MRRRSASSSIGGPGGRATATASRRRHPADHVRHPADGRALPEGHALRLRDPRRGAGDQERGERHGEGRAAPARQAPARAQRARRSKTISASLWSLFEFLNPRPAGARRRSAPRSRPAGTTIRPRAAARGPRAAAVHPAPDEGAGRPRAAGADRADHLRASSTATSVACTTSSRCTTSAASARERRRARDLGKMQIHVLEALLRLRQAACHPGLLDKKLAGESSAKLEVLLERLAKCRGRRAQGAGLLAVHEPSSRSSAGCWTRKADSVRVPRRPDARTARRR